MFDVCRQARRLFCFAAMLSAFQIAMFGATPPMTSIGDTVYRADGRPAGGSLLISWPTFTTANGAAVAAGNKSVTLGPQGILAVDLTPNIGATPANTYYTVVFQLDDGTVRTEYWSVPTASPANLASVRATLGATSSAAQMASRQYVDVALSGKANDVAVVHLTGNETIAGVKQFSSPLSVPVPSQPSDAANKAYVDGVVNNTGSGSYVNKNGDTMTGPLTLVGDPTSSNHATTRHYVDNGLAAKANLVAGIVPTAQLGSGTADNTLCLKGDSSWGPCGTSSNAVSIQNVPVDIAAPADNQVITYEASSGKYKPKQGGGITAGMQAVKYATDFAWTQSPSSDLSTAGAKTVTLAGCGTGVKASEPEYYVYIAGTGTAEAVKVTGGTCNGDGQPGTLQFTTANAHSSGYTISSASSGLQEALIAARMVPTNPTGSAQAGKVIAPPNEFRAYARVSVRSSNLTLDFSGSILECYAADTCLFIGDGLSTRFYLSQTPFTRSGRTIMEEEYAGTALDSTRWLIADPAHAISVTGGKLRVSGGNDQDGQTTVCFAEKVELGGAVILQHGDTTFDNPSEGVLGGLYASTIKQSGCLAGFRLQPSGSGSRIQALINGVATGPSVNTVGGHRYSFTTRLYATEIYRREQSFHSSKHSAGKQVGGGAIGASLRVVLEVHDVDPGDPGSYIEPSIVLFDGMISNAPGFVTYALVNAINLHCSLTFTRFLQAMDAEVRSALPGESYRTRLTGSLADGAECLISQDALQFFPEYVPGPNELIDVRYRGLARSLARVTDPASVARNKLGDDNGVRGVVRDIESPPPRSSTDCENAALALLDDGSGVAWSGDYQTWSDYLPGNAQDIFPGDALDVNVPSRGAVFCGIVREVRIVVKSLADDHSVYDLHFADDAAESLGFAFQDGHVSDLSEVASSTVTQVGTHFLDELISAEITEVGSTTVTIDAGVIPPEDGAFEVRRTDLGWGQENDRNLVGRFATRTFTVPRLARVQDYYLRQYGGSNPVRYSRFSTALHLDFPL